MSWNPVTGVFGGDKDKDKEKEKAKKEKDENVSVPMWKIIVGVLWWPFGIYLIISCARQKKNKKSEKGKDGKKHLDDIIAQEDAQGKDKNQNLGPAKKSFNQPVKDNADQQPYVENNSF